jgi:hypothetical protein
MGRLARREVSAWTVRAAEELHGSDGRDAAAVAVLVLHEWADAGPAAIFSRRLRELNTGMPQAVVGPWARAHRRELARLMPNVDMVGLQGDWDLVEWVERAGAGMKASGPAPLTREIQPPAPCYEAASYPAAADPFQKLLLFEVEDGSNCLDPGFRNTDMSWLRENGYQSSCTVCDELQRLSRQFGVHAFAFAPSIASAAWAGALARAMLRAGLAVQYSRSDDACFAESECAGDLARSGCVAAAQHVRTGSQRLLEEIYGRRATVTHMERLLRSRRRAGVYTIARLTFPSPFDDFHTREETLRLLARSRPHAALIEGYEGPSATAARDAVPGALAPAGASAAHALRLRQALAGNVEQRGIATSVCEKTALVGSVLGRADDLAAFAADVERLLTSGNRESLQELLGMYYKAAQRPAAAQADVPGASASGPTPAA